MIWSEKAIDYKAGFTITHPSTGETYTEEGAKNQPPEIRRQLVMRPNKIGTWVMTIKESNEALKKQQNEP